jgi:hypothetical protein
MYHLLKLELINERAEISKKNKNPPHATLAKPMPSYNLTFFDFIQAIGLKISWRHKKQQITHASYTLQLYSIIQSNDYNIFELFLT